MLLSTVDRSVVEERLDPAFYAPQALAVEAWLDERGEDANEQLTDLVEFIASAFYEGLAGRYNHAGTQLIRVGDVRLGTVADDHAVFLDDSVATGTRGLRTVRHPCLVLTKGGSVGRVGVTPTKGMYAVSRDVIGLQPESTLELGRVLFFLASVPGRAQILRGASRQVQAHLTLGQLQRMRVPKVTTSDAARLNKSYDELRKARLTFSERRRQLNELFAKTDPFAQLRNPPLSYALGRKDALRIRMDAAYYRPGFLRAVERAIAQGWTRLADLPGLSFDASVWDRSTAVQSEYVEYVPLAAIEPFSCRIARPKIQRVWSTPTRAKWIVCEGDVLVPSLLDCLDRVGYVDADNVESIASSGFHLVRPSDPLDGLRIAAYMSSDGAQQQILRAGSGTRFRSVNPDLLAELFIPPIDPKADLPGLMRNLRTAAVNLQNAWHDGIRLAEQIVGWEGSFSAGESESEDLDVSMDDEVS